MNWKFRIEDDTYLEMMQSDDLIRLVKSIISFSTFDGKFYLLQKKNYRIHDTTMLEGLKSIFNSFANL